MTDFDFDLFVIGAGSAGTRLSRVAAGLGARVGVAEDLYLGGTCVNVGCVPKKLFVHASHFGDGFETARGFGWNATQISHDWSILRGNKDTEIQRLNGIYEKLIQGAGAEILHGTAHFVDAHTVEVGARRITAERIAIATGGWPMVPDIPGREHAITSNEVFHLDALPERALVVGGGYIAVEFAGIFKGLGLDTTLTYRGDLFLRGFDIGVRHFVADEIAKKGVRLRFNTNPSRIEKRADGDLLVTFEDGSTQIVDLVLYATGRRPRIAELNLAAAGVDVTPSGAIHVDEDFRTNVPHIHALGDVIDRVQLTPVAIREAMVVAHALFGQGGHRISYEDIPTAVFCQPNIGTVGLIEEAAVAKYPHLDIYETDFKPLLHSISGMDERTYMKVIVDRDSDRVVGVHMVGDHAGEVIQGIGIAMHAGARKQDFDDTVGIHPTTAEEFVTMREPSRRIDRDAA